MTDGPIAAGRGFIRLIAGATGALGAGSFAAGTHIAVQRPNGRVATVPVEELHVGDTVRVAGRSPGTRKIIAIAQRRIDIAAHAAPGLVTPVRLAAGALADGVPTRVVLLPLESLLFLPNPADPGLDGVLVPVGALLNGTSIRRAPETPITSWYTLQLGGHDVVLAEAMRVGTTRLAPERPPARAKRSRTAGEAAPPPVTPRCARLLAPGAELTALRLTLSRRALPDATPPAAAPPPPADAPVHAPPRPRSRVAAPQPMARLIVTAAAQAQQAAEPNPDRPPLHLVCNTRSVHASEDGPDGWLGFDLPGHGGPVQLVTPIGRAASAEDVRKLGVPILALELDGAPIPLDGPELGLGFHAGEGHGGVTGWRWTDGAAWLVLPQRSRPARLRIRVAPWFNTVIR